MHGLTYTENYQYKYYFSVLVYLPATGDLLIEDPKLITNAITICCQTQRCH